MAVVVQLLVWELKLLYILSIWSKRDFKFKDSKKLENPLVLFKCIGVFSTAYMLYLRRKGSLVFIKVYGLVFWKPHVLVVVIFCIMKRHLKFYHISVNNFFYLYIIVLIYFKFSYLKSWFKYFIYNELEEPSFNKYKEKW